MKWRWRKRETDGAEARAAQVDADAQLADAVRAAQHARGAAARAHAAARRTDRLADDLVIAMRLRGGSSS